MPDDLVQPLRAFGPCRRIRFRQNIKGAERARGEGVELIKEIAVISDLLLDHVVNTGHQSHELIGATEIPFQGGVHQDTRFER